MKPKFSAGQLAYLSSFISEREDIRLRREAGKAAPWTLDEALKKHSFCNINREHDAVTIYIREHFRSKLEGRSLAYAVKQMLFCRIFNEPATLALACPLEDLAEAKAAIEKRSRDSKVFRGAYLMPAHEQKGYGAIDYWFRALADTGKLEFGGVSTLAQVAAIMMTVKGVGGFVANQVCADLRYVKGLAFSDWGDFVLCGPGTRRGLNRLSRREVNGSLSSKQATAEVLALRKLLATQYNQREAEHFNDPNNVANSLCEFDKYCRFYEEGGRKLKKYGRNKTTQTILI